MSITIIRTFKSPAHVAYAYTLFLFVVYVLGVKFYLFY